MKIRTLFLLIILVAITAFAALNWSVFTTPATLSLGVTVIQAPLGLVMLGLLAFLSAVFLVFVIYLQTSVLLEARRHARELHANRELANQAETSRFTELREFVEAELKRQANSGAESSAALMVRLDQLDRDLRSAVEQSGNTLAAYIGELEDRIESGTQGITPSPNP
ncbi:MAG: LapA family protein [Desulfobacterium sp.]|nr:LapA family protein [Desulfobacterium sp.]MBU3947159.1 LapA family protein [Pseudomonadota bacterium]MBU4010314.1 LapA family protein [Pseudomonadota bacterium]